MFRRIGVTFIFMATVISQALSQSAFKENNAYDFTASFGKRQGSVALSWSHVSKLGNKKKRLGAMESGLRHTLVKARISSQHPRD